MHDFRHFELTEHEQSCIRSLRRLAKKWNKEDNRLWLFAGSGDLHVMLSGDIDSNPVPEMDDFGNVNPENSVAIIHGIPVDGGAW